jgi:hypothetical protein
MLDDVLLNKVATVERFLPVFATNTGAMKRSWRPT